MKNPNSPKRSDFDSFTDYTKAYSKFYRENNPTYFKKWREKPENAEKYGKRPPGNCPKCNSVLHKPEGSTGSGRCLACKAVKEAELKEFHMTRARQSEAKAARIAAKQLRVKLRAEERLKKAAERKAATEETFALWKKLASRKVPLSENWFFQDEEIERFWSRVQKTESCWLWTSSKNFSMSVANRGISPHRISWFLVNGPCDHLAIGRTCGSPLCVNPDHLAIFDQAKMVEESRQFKKQFKPINGLARSTPDLAPKQAERFWSKVDKSLDCWVFTGYKSKPDEGYGTVEIRGIKFQAHRIAFKLHYGHIDDTLQVHHSCDSPFCVNPAHLTQGDNLANAKDSFSRQRSGFVPFLNKEITPDPLQVPVIRELHKKGISIEALSKKFGAHTDVITQIISGVYAGC